MTLFYMVKTLGTIIYQINDNSVTNLKNLKEPGIIISVNYWHNVIYCKITILQHKGS